MLDVLFINPVNSFGIYQDLSALYTTIEPPTWALLLAQSMRNYGFEVGILDCGAERLSDEEALKRIKNLNPKLLAFVVYGQNVNASAVGMSGAVRLSNLIRQDNRENLMDGCSAIIAYFGNYVQALPRKTLEDEPSIDIIFMNEGVYALRNVLQNLDKVRRGEMGGIKGIAWRGDNGNVVINPPELTVSNEKLDSDMPGYAWDLLPFKEKPFDLYRAPMWHAEYNEKFRTPYAAIQSSLGCFKGCEFCIINTINRNDNAEIGIAGNYSKMRYWSPELILKEFDKLWNYGVRTIKITDELFLFNKKYYVPLCQGLKDRGYGKELKLWVYSRVDTVANPELLDLVREAGVKYIALGIESSAKSVRLEISKGKFEDVDIKKVVKQIHDAGIEVMANYIFGLPGDTMETMRETLNLSKELCTSGWNAYAAMNLPGSKLYADAIKKGKPLPETYTGYSFHAYDTVCNSTDTLTAAQILKFRDEAYTEYHTYQPFLDRITQKYGKQAADNIREMAKIKLKRKLLGD